MAAGERPDLPAVRLRFIREGKNIQLLAATPAPDVLLAREIDRPMAEEVEGSWYELHNLGEDEPLYTFAAIDPARVFVESFTDKRIDVMVGDAPVTFDLYVPNVGRVIDLRIFSSEMTEAFDLSPLEPAAKFEIDLGGVR